MAKPIKIGKKILEGDDLKHKCTVLDVDFVFKCASPAERSMIEMDVVRRLGGQPRDSFSASHINDLTVRATLRRVIDSCSDEDFDVWESWDVGLIYAAFDAYTVFQQELLKRD